MSAQDVVQLLDTQAFFDLLHLPYPTDQAGVLSRLLDERLITRNATQAFTSWISVRSCWPKNLRGFPRIGRKATRVIVYAGESSCGPTF